MHTKLKIFRRGFFLKLNTLRFLGIAMILSLTSCSDFVEVELPKSQLSTEAVFNDPGTVDAALKSIYGKMRTNGLLSGRGSGLSVLLSLYTDELDLYGTGQDLQDFQNHSLLATNGNVTRWWSNAYEHIYAANAVIEGVSNSESLMVEDRDQFKGEALFIRAYLHLLLVELYGDIPYITTTNYIENTTVTRMPRSVVYDHIITDLILAIELLDEAALLYQAENKDIKADLERTRPYAVVAEAVLARAYLYNENWEDAEASANSVISEFGALEPDLDKVFLKDASGTIWQFKPNVEGQNTNEGSASIFTARPTLWALSDELFFAFESGSIFQPGDQRQTHWIKTVTVAPDTWRHAYKYKERNNTGSSVEYSIQLRLAEQYLIRAEARAQQGDIPGAQADINAIRNRAGLGNTTADTLDTLLDAILDERRFELFTEQGHRWFDLKRMGKAKAALEPIKPGWRDTDILFPIPDQELGLNPNLLPQNNGY